MSSESQSTSTKHCDAPSIEGTAARAGESTRDKLKRPRGYYFHPEPWAKDKTHKYFQGYMNKVVWPVSKGLMVILLIFALA